MPAPDDTTTDEPETYYGDIESYFVECRGSPLFITPAEWALVSTWEEAGIPLSVVKEGIDRVFERPQTSTRPKKLGYCRQSVEAAYRRYRELSLGGRAPGEGGGTTADPFDVTEHLPRLASLLRDSFPEHAVRVAALDGASMRPSAIEKELDAIDQALLDAAERAIDDGDRAALMNEASDSLASYRDRMPDNVFQSALRSAYRRRLRKQCRLPRLSLYDR